MFHSARLKLTTFYLLIIMAISVLFSLVIYTGIDRELTRFERMRGERVERGILGAVPPRPSLDPQLIGEARDRLIFTLVLINLGILILSGAAGYLLASLTLKPIADMVDEQNRFITDASHELRTPLTSLKSEIEVALRAKSITAKESKELLASNLEEVNKLQNLSDSLIKITQYQKNAEITAQKNSITIEKTPIEDVLDAAVRKVTVLAKGKKIDIEKKITQTDVKAEKTSLLELFVILLDNAIKYSPKGGKVRITTKRTDGIIHVLITDSGIGINKEDMPLIFNRFYRGNPNRPKTNGYGLGLSIAQEIAKRHGGTINVESKLGRGSTFSVALRKA